MRNLHHETERGGALTMMDRHEHMPCEGWSDTAPEDLLVRRHLSPAQLNALLDNRSRLYRVKMRDEETARVTPLDDERQPVLEEYKLGDEPKWITDRVRALSIFPPPPPLVQVDGIGFRLASDLYWVLAPEGWRWRRHRKPR